MEEKEDMEIPDLKQLLEAGCHFGHQVRRANPKMAPYIFQARDKIHIIDLVQTRQKLEEACQFVKKQATEDKIILFVGTKKQAQEIVREEAQRVGMPYLANRWVGGFLTNFEVVKKNLGKLKNLRSKLEDKEYLLKITKKEKAQVEKEKRKLERNYQGVVNLEKLPDVIFIVDSHKEELAVKEANKKEIPIVAICDTNANPQVIDYPIPSNDDAGRAIKLLVKTVADATGEGQGLRVQGIGEEKEKVEIKKPASAKASAGKAKSKKKK